MFFLHCDRCDATLRAGLPEAAASSAATEDIAAFHVSVEHVPYLEETEVALDATLFVRDVDAALAPPHPPRRRIAAWMSHVGSCTRSLQPDDVVLLHDEASHPECSAARLTPAARASLEAALPAFGFDETSGDRLRALFEDEEFPPLRVTRRLLTGRSSIAAQRHGVGGSSSSHDGAGPVAVAW